MTTQLCPPPQRILVVEDDPTIGALIAEILGDEGFETVVVHDGREAMRRVSASQPDAITLDLGLPGMDGHAILRRLAGDDADGVPVVVVSAATETLSREERRRATETLSKPFDVLDLVRAVSHAVGRA